MNIMFVRILLFIDAQIVAHHFLDLLTGMPNAFPGIGELTVRVQYVKAIRLMTQIF